jgi:hypothetical protein
MARMARIVVLEPVAAPRPPVAELAHRPGTLDGKRLGFLDNGKPNADVLLAAIEEFLSQRASELAIVRERKRAAGAPADTDMLDRLVQGADLAVVGVGD